MPFFWTDHPLTSFYLKGVSSLPNAVFISNLVSSNFTGVCGGTCKIMHELNFIWRERWGVLADACEAVREEQVCEASVFPLCTESWRGPHRWVGLTSSL